MSEHPHHLLAEYVDGTLHADELSHVERHLDGCPACRDETGIASSAASALRDLPEAQPPLGTAERVLRHARRAPPPALAWRLAGAAAAAIVVAVAFVALRGPQDRAAVEPYAAERAGDAAAPADGSGGFGEAEGGETADATEERTALEASAASAYPSYRESPRDYAPVQLVVLSRRVAREAREAMDAGLPSSAEAFYRTYDLRSLEPDAQRALSCVTQGDPPDRAVVPFVIEAARFEGRPAYLAAFLLGPSPEAAYDRLQLVVVSRDGCTIRHFSQERL